MSNVVQDDFLSGFMFGVLVTQAANGLERRRMSVMPNIRECLRDIADGTITLIDSPEEVAPEIGQVPALLQAQADRMLRDNLRNARDGQRQQAA